MAVGIATLSNMQLSVLQAPEIAREQVPFLAQAQAANAQAPAIIAGFDRIAAETVQRLERAQSGGVPDALAGHATHERPAYGQSGRRNRALEEKTIVLAGAHPAWVGSLVDIRA